MNPVRLGTRGSRLAVAQARWVAELLRSRSPNVDVQLVEIQTSGDVMRHDQLGPEFGQGFFTKEIEAALLEGEIDVAVHSLKDLASRLPEGLRLAAVPLREDPHDVLVTRGATLAELPEGATLGTSSVRRQCFLHRARPDLEVQNLRGNVPTRVRAVDEGRVDGVVVSGAGLKRLGLADRITEVLRPPLMLPAAGQGSLALQVRDGDEGIEALVRHADDAGSHAEARAERACLRRLAAGCQAPVGILGRSEDGRLSVEGVVVGPDGPVHARVVGSLDEAEETGARVAVDLLDGLGLASLAGVPWAGPPPREGAGRTPSGGLS